MDARSLTIILPAYNEEGRLGPALDELFGYLRRRADRGRDGAPAPATSRQTSTCWSWTTGARTAPPPWCGPARGDRRGGWRRTDPRPPQRASRRKGSGRPGRNARRRHRRGHLHGRGPRDTGGPDSDPLRGPPGPRRRPGQPDPAGWSRHASVPAGLPPVPGTDLPRARLRVGGRTGAGHAMRVQGLQPPRGPRPVRPQRSPASSSTSRSSTSPAAAATGWRSCRFNGPTSAGRACTHAPASPSRWPGTSSGSPSSTAAFGVGTEPDTRSRSGHNGGMVMLGGDRPGRSAAFAAAALRLGPALVLVLLAVTSLAILGAAGDTLGYDFQAYARAADRLLAGQPLYDPTVDVAGGFAIYLYPPPFALAVIPFAALPDPAGTWAWLAFLVACFLGGTALLPVRPSIRWTVVALAALSFPFLYGLKLGQVAPILYLCFAIGWRSLDRPLPLALSTVAGALVKVQPAILLGWMAADAAVGRPGRGVGGACCRGRRQPARRRRGRVGRLRRAPAPCQRAGDDAPQHDAGRGRLPGRGCPPMRRPSSSTLALALDRCPHALRVAAPGRRDRVRGRRRREPADVTAPLGPLRDAPAPPGRPAPATAAVVGRRDPAAAVAADGPRLPGGLRAPAWSARSSHAKPRRTW